MARWLLASAQVMVLLGAFEPVNDRHVAGQHVRQIFQQPQRRKLGHPVAAPVVQIEVIARRGRRGHGAGEFVQIGVDQARADVAAEAVAVEMSGFRYRPWTGGRHL